MKKIIVIIMLFLLSGCSSQYNLIIHKDLTISETNELLELSSNLEKNVVSVKFGIMSMINSYYFNDEFNKYNYELKEDVEYSGATFSREYNNLYELMNSYFVESSFNETNIIEEDNLIIVKLSLDKNFGFLSNNYSDPYAIMPDATINIQLPFKVVSGNYDSVSSDILTWNYNTLNIKDELTFTFDTSLSTDGSKIETTSNNISNATEENNFNILYILIAFFVIIIIGTLAIYTIYLKKNKV